MNKIHPIFEQAMAPFIKPLRTEIGVGSHVGLALGHQAPISGHHTAVDHSEPRRNIAEIPAATECERCAQFEQIHDQNCPEHPDYDPTPWCSGCGSRTKSGCHCGPIAENE